MKPDQSINGYRQYVNNRRPGFRIAAAAVGPDLLDPLIGNGAWLPKIDLADAVAHGAVQPGTIVQEDRGTRRGRYFLVEQGRLTQCDYAGRPLLNGRVLLLIPTKNGARLREVSALEAAGRLLRRPTLTLKGT